MRKQTLPLHYLFHTIALAIVCFAPFCFARTVEIQMPPAPVNMSVTRDREKTMNTSLAAATAEPPTSSTQLESCQLCAGSQAAALEKLLRQYKELADNGGWPAWTKGKKIRPGAEDARIPTLRQLLTITGDYKPASGISSSSTRYDDALVAAVEHFQDRHGLNKDAEIGKSTQAALAVPVSKRISQIMATLARIKSRQEPAEGKFVLVNLPAYRLWGVDQGKTALTMRVIVGSRLNHTPLFDNAITDVVFNPPWSVPARIVRNEMIPKLRANPSYFIKAGFTVTQDGVAVDPMHVDPDSGTFSFRQRSGDGNALGKIKFNIPDSDDIYLHSTSSPKLFIKEDRALSHGCIRLEKPRDLAHFIMGSEEGWTSQKIDHAYDASAQRSVEVDDVPVHLVYWTAFVDESGVAHFYDDVYGKDTGTNARLYDSRIITLAVAE